MQRYRVVIMLVLFGVLPVVVAFFVALSFLEEQEIESPPIAQAPVVEAEPPPPPPETQKVFAAARALPVGTLLGKEELGTIEIDVTEIDEDHIEYEKKCTAVSDEIAENARSRTLCGYAVRTALAEGAPLTWSAVVGPGQEGFLAAVLRPGTRAVMVRVGEATRQAGLIDPGDRVDVILSAELSIDGGERIVFARTIAEDVRVVAIDRPSGGRRGQGRRARGDFDRNPGSFAGAGGSAGARRARGQALAGGSFSRRTRHRREESGSVGRGGAARDAAVFAGLQ